MYTQKDIEARTIFVINCIDQKRIVRVASGEMKLEENSGEELKTLTVFPFQKILALFIIGHATITTALIDKCKKFDVALVVLTPTLRPVFYWADFAEANYLLRKRQHTLNPNDISIAKILVFNKIENQFNVLNKTRKKDELTRSTMLLCKDALDNLDFVNDINSLLGIEGTVAKSFFNAYFQDLGWRGRRPRSKCDPINSTLDIGYHILFNYIECFVRLFGFDVYVGVYHRLWFKRKSLICDLVEPFRCIIDHTVLLAYKKNHFSVKDFENVRGEYRLKTEKCAIYYNTFYEKLIEKRMDVFIYIQSYYRCFMGCKSVKAYPKYIFLNE